MTMMIHIYIIYIYIHTSVAARETPPICQREKIFISEY
jgi:hypothetical protein